MSGRIRISLLGFVVVLLSSMFLSTHVWATPDVTQPYTYTVATIGQPRTLDPSWAYDATSQAIIFNVYETLIEQDRGSVNDFIPELATEWSISPDGLTYTFKIRTGVTFSNGNPLTPSDIEYSLERTMVRDRVGGPNWMFYVPIIGTFGGRYYPGVRDPSPRVYQPARAALGQLIANAFTSNGTHVFIHLSMPQGFFMQILSQSWGSIVDQEWMSRTVTFPGGAVDTFDWDGSWGANGYEWWIFNNYAREAQAAYFSFRVSPLDNPPQMMGTGAFTFVEWIHGEGGHRTLSRNAGYWGGWPAGATGTARAGKYPIPSRGYIDTYIEYQKSDWATRKQGLLDGTYDTVYVPRSNIGEVWQKPGIRCRYPMEPLSMDAIFFNFNIADGVPGQSPYVGTETWGTGLPLNAFSDINLRKAFIYSLNQTKILSDPWYYRYEAFQLATPIIPGLAPFTREELLTYHVANRKNIDLTKAEYYFKLAWGGVDARSSIPGVPVLPEDPTQVTPGIVWNQGFTFKAVYSVSCDPRVPWLVLLPAQLLAINPKFHMSEFGLGWPEFLDAMFYGPNDRSIMPLWAIGWPADYADADNFVTPFFYTAGDFSYTQSAPDFGQDALIDQARAETDLAVRKTLYTQVNDLWIQNVPAIMGMAALGRRWERDWVQGWYHNPAFPGTNLYTIWKEDLPIEDIDANGKVEIKDLSIAVKTYGSYYIQPLLPPYPSGPPGFYMPSWDSRIDLNQDMRVDIKDLAMIAKKFGHAQTPWTPP